MSPLYYPSGLKAFLEKELRQECSSVLGSGVAKICVRPDWGTPDAQVIETALEAQADIIIAGTSQRKGFARFGSTSRAILHYSPLSVVCVPFPTSYFSAAQERPKVQATSFGRELSRYSKGITMGGPSCAELATAGEKIKDDSFTN
jgi:hypothetical protein